jgi:hypothetical protein
VADLILGLPVPRNESHEFRMERAPEECSSPLRQTT